MISVKNLDMIRKWFFSEIGYYLYPINHDNSNTNYLFVLR